MHLACRSLNDGESDLALAGGASALLQPRKSASGSVQGMLSPTGRCRAFDVAADGFVSSRVASSCCSSGWRMRWPMVTGFWLWSWTQGVGDPPDAMLKLVP
ncbi:MAG TPA: beta-ketoacyl synthase N-terminal-like domain-containing protein [Mycobacterium sp.]|nr:beta-ketoacyl synthase N-terminal-like domain-containing protein [Mycobacterium sp.]